MNQRSQGFTLIELMITVAIVGILAAIAYPTYLNQVRKSRRSDARSALLQAANRQERYYTTQYKYANSVGSPGFDVPTVTENGFYKIKVDSADKTSFKMSATALKDQVNDTCRTLTIDQAGAEKAWTGAGAGNGSDVSGECW